MPKAPRLRLTPMGPNHLKGLCELNADPGVMAHFPDIMSHAQSAAHLTRMQDHWSENGFGLFALNRKDDGEFIGFTGLTHPSYETPFTPCVEVGWRLNSAAWGKGYALEAAQTCLNWGFKTLGLEEIVSFTSRDNLRSIALMKRLKMQSNAQEDFEHPMLATGHRLSWHVLYRIQNPRAKRA